MLWLHLTWLPPWGTGWRCEMRDSVGPLQTGTGTMIHDMFVNKYCPDHHHHHISSQVLARTDGGWWMIFSYHEQQQDTVWHHCHYSSPRHQIYLFSQHQEGRGRPGRQPGLLSQPVAAGWKVQISQSFTFYTRTLLLSSHCIIAHAPPWLADNFTMIKTNIMVTRSSGLVISGVLLTWLVWMTN